MKNLYKIGRLYIAADSLPQSYEPFAVKELYYDENTAGFVDAAGDAAKKPFGFDPEKNVLFVDRVSGSVSLEGAVCAAQLKHMSVWRAVGEDAGWIYVSRQTTNAMTLSQDYSRAVCYTQLPAGAHHPFMTTELLSYAVQCKLIRLGYVIMHAACIEVQEKAVLFSAPSGTGKSTRADRWVEGCDAQYISGDRPIIDTRLRTALGAPWDGKEKIFRNIERPIAALTFIARAEKTKFTRFSEEECKAVLPAQTFIPMWDPALVMEVFSGLNRIAQFLPVFRLACDQTTEAARECCRILFPGEPANIPELLENLQALDAPRYAYRVQMDNFLEFKARKLGVPRVGMFELTPLCNLDCKMCYVHLNQAALSGRELMPAAWWKHLMKQARDAGMMQAVLSGGECLTYPGFDELYLYLQSMGVEITVLTNGLLLDRERAQFFKEHPVRRIQVTLYGSCDDAYEKVTGVRCFERVYRNILYAKELKLPLDVTITPSAFSFDDMRPLLELAEKMGVSYSLNSILSKPRKDTSRDLHDLTNEQYIQVFQIQTELKSNQLQPVDPGELPDPKRDGEERRGIRCSAGRCRFCTTWDGKLAPCAALYDMAEPLEGRAFQEVWGTVRSKVGDLPLPRECSGCAYEQHCIQCIAQHHDESQPGTCNKSICERTQMMIEAGFLRL